MVSLKRRHPGGNNEGYFEIGYGGCCGHSFSGDWKPRQRTAMADARGRSGSLVRIVAPVMSSSAGIAGTWANVASVETSSAAGDMKSS